MSVIFEALRKVRHSEPIGSEAATDKASAANVYTIRGLIFSPQGILGMVAVVLFVGLFAYYGASYLNSALKGDKVQEASAQASKVSYIPPESSIVDVDKRNEAPEEIPPPPPNGINYEKPQPGKIYLPKQTNRLEVSKPASTSEPVHSPSQLGSKDSGRIKSEKTYKTRVENFTTLGKKPEAVTMADLPAHMQPSESVTQTTKRNPKDQKDRPGSDDVRNSITRVKNSLKPQIDASSASVDTKKVSSEKLGIQKPQQDKVKESWAKTAKISRLVKSLQAAMTQGNNAKIKELLPLLKELKGEDDPFLLKLRAFWEMKKGDYDSATRLLERVLAQRPRDCEAGVNMAIIEIEKGQREKAKERLKELRELYPDSDKVAWLLRKINE